MNEGLIKVNEKRQNEKRDEKRSWNVRCRKGRHQTLLVRRDLEKQREPLSSGRNRESGGDLKRIHEKWNLCSCADPAAGISWGLLGLDFGNKLFPVGLGRPWHRFPESLWDAHPWKCPQPGWTGLGSIWDSGRCGMKRFWRSLPTQPLP